MINENQSNYQCLFICLFHIPNEWSYAKLWKLEAYNWSKNWPLIELIDAAEWSENSNENKKKKNTTMSTKNTFAQNHQSLYWRRISLYEWQKNVQVKLNQPSWASDVHFDTIFFYFIFYHHFLVMLLLLLLLLILRWKLCVQDKCSAEQQQKKPIHC